MISDCYPGAISQYFHRYEQLFHSITQVIYYNWPSYHRISQESMEAINANTLEHKHILPLLFELDPDATVLYEHTGAGYAPEHAKHKLSWVVWNGFIFLVDKDMQAFCSSNIQYLYCKTQDN